MAASLIIPARVDGEKDRSVAETTTKELIKRGEIRFK